MKIKDIVVGHVYVMKVSGRLSPVRIDGEYSTVAYGTRAASYAGPRRMRKFYGTNLRTGRAIRPISPGRIRFEVEQLASGVWAKATQGVR